jgi:transposase
MTRDATRPDKPDELLLWRRARYPNDTDEELTKRFREHARDDLAIVALTYRATVDVPARFRKSKSVGAVFGLTPARDQSGERDRPGAISRCGDEMMRTTLYEAAQVMLLRSSKWSWLKAWAMKIAKHRGMKKAIVALARRLAVIMHRIWTNGSEFRWTREAAAV